jgi:hypothetical protein
MEAEITIFAEDSTNKCQLDFFSECYSLGLSPSIFEMAKKHAEIFVVYHYPSLVREPCP